MSCTALCSSSECLHSYPEHAQTWKEKINLHTLRMIKIKLCLTIRVQNPKNSNETKYSRGASDELQWVFVNKLTK